MFGLIFSRVRHTHTQHTHRHIEFEQNEIRNYISSKMDFFFLKKIKSFEEVWKSLKSLIYSFIHLVKNNFLTFLALNHAFTFSHILSLFVFFFIDSENSRTFDAVFILEIL